MPAIRRYNRQGAGALVAAGRIAGYLRSRLPMPIDFDSSAGCDLATSLPRSLFHIQSARIVWPGGAAVFDDFTWSVDEGETWAIVGPVGSGKTTLADAIAGRLHLEQGEIAWPFIDRLRAFGRQVNWPSEVIHRVSFKEESRLFSYARHYYQQRFNFIEPEDDLTLDAFLRSGFAATDDAVELMAERFGIAGLRGLSLIKLSNGQTRRARLAKALLARPELLILDDPFMGLDEAGRRDLAEILGGLVLQGTRLVLITRPDAIPDWITHVLELDRLAVPARRTRSEFLQHRANRLASAAVPNLSSASDAAAAPIIEMRRVNVVYDGRSVLQNISWTVRAGQRWAVLGPNGSGKSTLLSLICGDHPQAYANDIRLFGKQRGSGESIWDIKKQIGLVSPELHLYFTEPLTAFQAAATGFFDVLAYRRTSAEQGDLVRDFFEFLGLLPQADLPFTRLSTGQQRLVLLVRALVKAPPLLILDEPFQALDRDMIERLRDWLDERLRPDQTLIFVSHYAEEIPHGVNRRLLLQDGRVVEREGE